MIGHRGYDAVGGVGGSYREEVVMNSARYQGIATRRRRTSVWNHATMKLFFCVGNKAAFTGAGQSTLMNRVCSQASSWVGISTSYTRSNGWGGNQIEATYRRWYPRNPTSLAHLTPAKPDIGRE